MKIQIKNKILGVLAALLLVAGFSSPAFAEAVSAQDLKADEALLGPDAGGMLPPTGSQGIMAVPYAGANPASLLALTRGQNVVSAEDQTDKQGQVYHVKGNARIAMKDVEGWEKVKVGTVIKEGHIIITKEGAEASVTFDGKHMNVVHIPQNTRVVFSSIEPTDIKLEDGTVFNMIDGLQKGGQWKVSTPTAVAAVRGTYWVVQYTSSTGELIAATFDIPDDNQSSAIELVDLLDNGSEGSGVTIPEGNQIDLKEGQSPDPSLLEKVDENLLNQIEQIMKDLLEERNSQGALPPTGGDPLDKGQGNENQQNNLLDPQLDTQSTVSEEEEPSESLPQELPEEPEEEPEEECNSFECFQNT